MNFSVIICAHTEERWQDLIEAVASVANQTIPPHQIVVAIDHNPAMLARARAQFPEATVVENVQERGLNGTRNSGVAATTGEIVAFLDDDAIAAPDWLEQLQAAYTAVHIVGAGGKINPLWLNGRPRWFPEEFNWVVGCTYRGLPEQTAPVRNLIGCNMSYRRAVIEQMGGFRNGIGHVGGRPQGDDETEFCIRLRQAMPQATLLYQPQAQVSHKVPAGRANFGYYRWRCYLEGRSKALLSRLVGANDGLSTERTYTLKVLPSGMWHGLTDSARHRNLAGIGRAAAIAAGLFITTFGYGLGRLTLVGKRVE
ncbi:MAG: glycosyltransferase family 2 protein [Anaerolineae bacterium]|nr:glycosyltransferase family 2 protein [Anaerolineae bacterium]